jgi:hypothetical protein
MSFAKMERDSRSLLDGRWSAKKYANEVIINSRSSKYGINVVSKPVPMRAIKEKLSK